MRPALLAALERWLSRETVTLTFDDVQWADEAATAALEHVLLGILDASTRRGQFACSILALQEVDDGPVARMVTRLRSQTATVSIHLEGLTEEQIASLVRNGTGLQCPPQLLRRVVEATGGNPLIVSELFRRSGVVDVDGLGLPAEVRIPTTALESARRALATIQPDVRRTLAVASQWFGSFAVDDLVPVVGEPAETVEAHFEEAWQQGVLAPAESGFEFSVPSMRQAAIHEVDRRQMALWNRAMVDVLRRKPQDSPAAIARHVLVARRLFGPEQRRTAFLNAANSSFASRAYADAALWYERTLSEGEDLSPGPSTAETLLRCAIAHQRNMDVPASEWRFRQALVWCRGCGDTEGGTRADGSDAGSNGSR